MVSLEPMMVDVSNIHSFAAPFLPDTKYDLSLSIFKSSAKEEFEFAYVIENRDSTGTVPQVFAEVFQTPNKEQAYSFIEEPLNIFKKFKKAILLFEFRAYSIDEFNSIAKQWRKDCFTLRENLK